MHTSQGIGPKRGLFFGLKTMFSGGHVNKKKHPPIRKNILFFLRNFRGTDPRVEKNTFHILGYTAWGHDKLWWMVDMFCNKIYSVRKWIKKIDQN
jgi:hypothetical protein